MSITKNYDSLSYRTFTKKSELDKALHVLEGILKGISIDNKINSKELDELTNWCCCYVNFINKHPFNELIPLIERSVADEELTEEEIKDILWFCDNFRTDNIYYDLITSDIQRLFGILHGIMSDNEINDEEIKRLKDWISENDYLSGCYPYDEIYSILVCILSDGVVSDEERNLLKVFFSEFLNLNDSKNINLSEINKLKSEIKLSGICALCPEITFENKQFCFTGISSKTTRKEVSEIVTSLNAIYKDSVSKSTDYLIVGNEGNPCWAYSCYGRKIETAVNLRKSGHKIIIVHENDFWDAIADIG